MILTFDCYGTLLNMRGVDDCIASIATQAGVDPVKAIATYAAYEDRLMYVEQINPYLDLVKANLAYLDMEMRTEHVFAAAYPQVVAAYQGLQPFADVNQALMTLHAAGNRLILMSNSTQKLMTAHAQVLPPVFEQVITTDDTGCYKPQPTFFDTVETMLPAGEHVHIAHGFWWDIVPATRRGWRRIWVNRDHLVAPEKYQPLQSVADLSEVMALL